MKGLAEKNYNAFDLFRNRWALVTAGTPDNYNGCTVSWGSMGTVWTRDNESGDILTVYIHPARHTCEFLKSNDTFTVSFFPEEYRKALAYMGSHSGRNEDKAAAAGLTPIPMGDSVDFKEANLTFLCKKLYQHPFDKEGIHESVAEYYKNNPRPYPVDENGQWQPHWVFVGEVIAVKDEQ